MDSDQMLPSILVNPPLWCSGDSSFVSTGPIGHHRNLLNPDRFFHLSEYQTRVMITRLLQSSHGRKRFMNMIRASPGLWKYTTTACVRRTVAVKNFPMW